MAQRGRPPKFSRAIRDPDRPEAPAKPEDVDLSLLSDAEKLELQRKAEARVLAREKDRAEEAYLAAEEDRIERTRRPQKFEEMRTITIDVALFAEGVRLDGKLYEYGRTYTVTKSVYDTIMEQAQRTYRHEEEISSGNSYNSFYSRQRFKNMPGKEGGSFAEINAQTGAVHAHNGIIPRF